MPKGDFSSATQEIIAKRAGYICSFPNCDKLLIGPASDPAKVSFVGHVGHIFPVSPNGPRLNAGITVEKLQSPHNGILLCAHHHSMIDADHGSKYSPSLLLYFKDIHEQRISRRLNQYSSPLGWIDNITIDSSPIIKQMTSVLFGHVTLLFGDNGAGKTYICDLLRGAFNPAALGQWLDRDMEYSVRYHAPVEHEVRVQIKTGKITYRIENEKLFLNPYNVSIVSPIESPDRSMEDDDITFLSRVLDIDEPLLLNMIRDKKAVEGLTFKDFEIEISKDDEERSKRRLRTQFNGGKWCAYENLSGGEQSCCQLDLAIALASFLSKYRPCSLILDSHPRGGTIDATNTKRYIEHLSSSSVRFQTIWVSPNKEPKIDWSGWQIAKLVGYPPKSSVEQNSL